MARAGDHGYFRSKAQRGGGGLECAVMAAFGPYHDVIRATFLGITQRNRPPNGTQRRRHQMMEWALTNREGEASSCRLTRRAVDDGCDRALGQRLSFR